MTARLRIVSFCLPVLALLCGSFALASEDGGLRSVFAEGAGCRALAMGDAGCALATDGSVLFRNPAGLGYLQRYEFQVGHSSLIGLGFGEQYLSAVAPSWRWGVAALGYRLFGVDGIEQRDEFNYLVSEDLQDKEQQLSLAYGRAFASGWSLGGALNIRRQELAGFSGSGVGLDLGLLIEPARLLKREQSRLRHVRLGLALRNAIEPSLKLDRASVPDPGSLRCGIACELPLGGDRRLSAVFDLEKTRNMDARLQAGIEFRYSLLALRGGYLRDRLTGGVGVDWRGMRFDYAWEDHPLEQVHRFALGFRFGLSREERRLAAIAAEDTALRLQLEQGFQARQDRRIEAWLVKAEEELRAGEFDRGLETLATVRAMDPENERMIGLSALAHLAKAEALEMRAELSSAEVSYRRALAIAPGYQRALEGLARCQAESNRRAARSEEMRRIFTEAMDAFSEDRLLAACTGFMEIIKIDPADIDAQTMLQRSEYALEQRLLQYLDRADRAIRRASFGDADNLLNSAEALAPDSEQLKTLRGQLAAAEEQAAARSRVKTTSVSTGGNAAFAAIAVPATRAPTQAELRELANLYRRGQEAAAAGRSDEAIRYWELIWSKQPGYQQVDEYLKNEYLMMGMEVFAEGSLEEAVELWQKALRIDPSDERALGYLARAREQLAKTREILK